MNGSEKQVKWANDIVAASEQAWNDLSIDIKVEAKERFSAMKDEFFENMRSDSASVIIANRFKFPEDAKMLKDNLAFFMRARLD